MKVKQKNLCSNLAENVSVSIENNVVVEKREKRKDHYPNVLIIIYVYIIHHITSHLVLSDIQPRRIQ